MSEMKFALKHPKQALVYALLGDTEYRHMRWSRSCLTAKDSALPFSLHASKATDIHEHLVTLFMLTVELNLRTVVELGTRGGESTVALLMAVKEIGGKVFSYDVDECSEAKHVIKQYGLEEYWEFTRGDDLFAKWNSPIDHLFIDTTHTYEQTSKELQRYEPFVRSGGIVTMHDSVSFPEVKQAVQDYSRLRRDIKLYEYLNNNGLFVLFKK
ncbi:MAG: class I SAM-dependent methyltransferase [Nitrososphaerota archaeon]|nr:class I SAM-dependent methyltransferase [Nitrososphaerota archaeon]